MQVNQVTEAGNLTPVAVWHGPRGIEVEAVMLGRKAKYRITQVMDVRVAGRTETRRYVLAYCRNVAEVAEHVDLADLVEVIKLPARAAS